MLTRYEYANTMRDLLGLDLDFAEDLPAEPNSPDKLKNNGSSLLMSPQQIEHYLAIARRAVAKAIVTGEQPEVISEMARDVNGAKGPLYPPNVGTAYFAQYPMEGEFRILVTASVAGDTVGEGAVMRVVMGVRPSPKNLKTEDVGLVKVTGDKDHPQSFELRGRMEHFPLHDPVTEYRERRFPGLQVGFWNMTYDQRSSQSSKRKKRSNEEETAAEAKPVVGPTLTIHSVSYEAPIHRSWPPEHHTQILFPSDLATTNEREYAGAVLARFMRRAYRRPVTSAEVERKLEVYDAYRESTGSIELAMREVLPEILVSHHFLYLAEPTDGEEKILWRITNINKGTLTVTNVSGESSGRSFPIDVHGLALSPDGKYIAGSPYVYDADPARAGWQLVRLFDANSGETAHDFPLTPMGNWFEPRATFSPDGRMLAVRRGATLQVWDVESKQQIGDMRGITAKILAVAFSAGGQSIITVSKDKISGATQAKFWDIHTRPGPDEFSLGKGPKRKMWDKTSEREHAVISGMDITPDGKTLFTAWSSMPYGPDSRVVTMTDLSKKSQGKRISELPIDPALNWLPDHAAFSPDGRWMALTGRPGPRRIQLWQLHSGDGEAFKPKFDREFPALQFMSNRVPSVAFSPDGKKLVYAGGRGDGRNVQGDLLYLVDIASGKETQLPADMKTWFAHARGIQGVWNEGEWEGECCGVALSSDSQHIFSVHKRYTLPWDTRIIAWDAATLKVLAVLESSQSLNHLWQTIALSHDDRLLATCQNDHSIFLWDVSEPELRRVHDELSRRAADPKNKPTDPAAKPLVEMRGHSNLISAVTFHPDGKILASASHDRTIKLWDVITGELRLTLESHDANVIALAFTPDGNTLISADNSGAVKLWHAEFIRN